MDRRRLLPVTGFALLTFVAAACGSTVQTTSSGQVAVPTTEIDGLGTQAVGDDLGSGADMDAGTGGLGASEGSGDPAGGGTGGAAGGADGALDPDAGGMGNASGTNGGAVTGSSNAGGASNRGAEVGPGVTSTQILVGRVRLENAGERNQSLGLGVASAPADKYDAAMVDHINKNGGAAGRKLKLSYYTQDANGGKSTAQLEQEQCAQWTQDTRVFAVLAGGTDNLRSCLGKAGVPMVYENVFSHEDKKTFDTFRTYYAINTIDLSTLGDTLPDQLAAGGYFPKGARIGLLTFDAPQYKRAVEQHLRPAMARRGLKFEEESYVHFPRSTDDQGNSIAQLPGFVLQQKAARVDHLIIFSDIGGGLFIFFSKAAASQDYHPAYGLTSASVPQIAVETGTVDPAEAKGAVAVGWAPIADVGSQPYTRYGPGYQTCASIMKAAGVPLTENDNNTGVALKTCDAFFFLKAAIDRGAPSVTLQSFVRGAESLGDSYKTALSYGSSISANHRSGVSVLATTAFDESCTCFKYHGQLRRLR
jgi:ABC-type branched-subunit amino acid transport system substrate-binding protein